ncbi:MAG: SDR family NAD(P)-dependent oxidoreductase [Rhodospirillaceae bacterium]|nr:MAG: SDR family NAD(P)-dependent oxidoreductase [Rhodospirillaceae bacterium]
MDFAERYGPWALIAGASEGTGRAFARKVAKQGLNCILIARREGPLVTLAEEVRAQYGVECITASVDLAANDAVDRLIDIAGAREVGLLITNAGADPNGTRFLDGEIGNWIDLVNLNVMNTMRSCHHFGGRMRARRRGGIILVGSGACYGGMGGIAVYCGSKAFDLCFGEGLWTELRPHGVDVLNLILGRTDTPAFRALLQSKGLPVPSGLASPDDVAEVGLARLPHGPVHNWGQDEDMSGYAPNSAAARRARILALDAASKDVMGGK